MNREHAEDIFEATNHNISKVRSKSRNKIVQSKTQAKPIELGWTAHPQLRALNLRHDLDVHYQPGANRSKKSKSSALAAAVQPTPKRDSVLRHWWENRSATALADERRWLLEELTGSDGFIDGKLQDLVFPKCTARRHPAANLLLQYARVGCLILVGRDWNPNEMEPSVTKFPHSSALVDDAILQIQVEAQEKPAQGFATIVRWDDIKHYPPSNLKISLLEMIPHKSRKYRVILDLSFALKVAGWDLPFVNEATK